jgi:hypothetical protein
MDMHRIASFGIFLSVEKNVTQLCCEKGKDPKR